MAIPMVTTSPFAEVATQLPHHRPTCFITPVWDPGDDPGPWGGAEGHLAQCRLCSKAFKLIVRCEPHHDQVFPVAVRTHDVHACSVRWGRKATRL